MSIAEILVRPADPEDATGIARVHAASIRGLASSHYTAAQISAWSGGKEPERYRQALAEGEVMFVAVNDEGEIVGFSAARGEEVRAVYVDPGQARRGIGSCLLAAIEEDALRRGETGLRLESSLNGRAFYAARGYEEQECQVRVLRSGAQLECILMTKALSPGR